ncbi:MAG: HEAT repeat domain-containing protein [Spirulinaceae cyanobacterium SM2_1_0]|nr:HEAT repeat domain-containing protein [Spirulinaceae cyanobacterium SM2_1_0]
MESTCMVLQQVEVAKAAALGGDWAGVLAVLRQWLQSVEEPVQGQSSEMQEAILALALQVLDAGDFATRWQVGKLLPAFGPMAIAPLIAILEDEEADLEERWFAGRLLGEFRSPEAIAALVRVLQKKPAPDLAAIAAHALANQGTVAIAPLTRLLSDPATSSLAVHALAQIPDAGVVPPLLGVVTHDDPAVRSAAILALSNFRDEPLMPVLVAAAQDRATAVRRAAAIGLGRRATPVSESELRPVFALLLKDLQMPVCEQAAIALGRLKTPSAIHLLAAELQSPLTPPPLQIAVIRALAWTEIPLALTLLAQALPHLPIAACLETIQVLGRVPKGPLQPQAAGILLAFWATHPAPAMLEPALLRALAHAWELLGDPGAVSALEQLRHHAQPQVALHASSALTRLSAQFPS